MVPVNINLGSRNIIPNGMHVLTKGIKIYVKDGDKHRINGPAEIHPNGYQAWFKKGIRHRLGGPAVIYPGGQEEYWENGKKVKVLKKECKNNEQPTSRKSKEG